MGCWVINHEFTGKKQNNSIIIEGSYDVNIWYSYDNDTKTAVLKDTNTYKEVVNIRRKEAIDNANEEIIVRSLKQPSCVKTDIQENTIIYTIEKELGIELVGDTKVKILANDEEEPWDEIIEDSSKFEEKIDDEVKEDFIEEPIMENNN